MLDRLKPYSAPYNGEIPPDIAPWQDETAVWAQDHAARMTLGYICDGGQADNTLFALADYLLTFNPQVTHGYPDRYLFAATALAICGYLSDGQHDEAEIWRLTGCLRLATCGHRRKASLGDKALADCVRTVYELAKDKNLPLLSDVISLYERMFGVLVSHDHAENLAIAQGSYGTHGCAAADDGKLGQILRARDWQYSKLFLPTLELCDLEEAEHTLRNRISLRAHMHVRHQFGDEINWHVRLFDDKETMVGLNGLGCIVNLASCYHKTGDERYARKAIELLWSWYRQCPYPNYHHGPNTPWRTLETGNRMGRMMPLMLNYLGQLPAFDDDTHAMLARMRLDHMRYLTAFTGPHNNWYQQESSGLAIAAIYSQELRNWQTYLRIAMRRLRWINNIAYFKDGFQFELAHQCHDGPTRAQLGVFMAGKIAGIELPSDFVQLMEKASQVYLHTAQPDFYMARFNDASSSLRSSSEALTIPARLFERSDFIWGATKGQQGLPPEHTSHQWPQSGLYVMRSGWEADAQFMHFDGAPFGASHQHEDKLNFVIYDGRELLVDPGMYSHAQTPLTHYFWGSRAHNTILIDGKEQARKCLPASHLKTQGKNEWVSSKSFDFVSSEYLEGYAPNPFDPEDRRFVLPNAPTAGFDDSFTHKRAVFYVKPGYWILCDQVMGQDNQEHTLNQLFQLGPVATPENDQPYAPGQVQLQNNAVYSCNPGQTDLALLPVDNTATASLHCGEMDPPAGWWSVEGESPMWQVDYAQSGVLPQRMDVVLFPLKEDNYSLPVARRLHADEHTTAFEIKGNGFQDTFLLCDAKAGATTIESPLHGTITFEGRALLVRKDGTCHAVRPVAIQTNGQTAAPKA